MNNFELVMIPIFLILIIKFLLDGFFNSMFNSYFRAKEKYEKKERENEK